MRSESSGGRKVLPRMRSEVIIGSIESDDFAFPGVCSPVEAGEVARIACRRGGDLPRGLRKFAQDDTIVFARERGDRGKPEDWSAND